MAAQSRRPVPHPLPLAALTVLDSDTVRPQRSQTARTHNSSARTHTYTDCGDFNEAKTTNETVIMIGKTRRLTNATRHNAGQR